MYMYVSARNIDGRISVPRTRFTCLIGEIKKDLTSFNKGICDSKYQMFIIDVTL